MHTLTARYRHDQSGAVGRRRDVVGQSRILELPNGSATDRVSVPRDRIRAVEIGVEIFHVFTPDARENRDLRQTKGKLAAPS